MKQQSLGTYDNQWFDRGRPLWVEALWILASAFVSSSIPGSACRIWLLRKFKAKIADGVVVKPRVRVKFPWRLSVGANTWIGEGVWMDNLGEIKVGENTCISQGVYICTGSHDWSKESFDLLVNPVVIGDGVWIGAFAKLAPGLIVGDRSVVTMGAVVADNVSEGLVFGGNPAKSLKSRY